ncbi:MAG: hypothetical protein M3153_07730 [Chloroflexota bacterium]|nr:hypothetical protein [Chloroflexota bacterium]
MKADRDLRDLELRLSRALEAAAPPSDSRLAERLLSRTAEVSQRRRSSLFSFVRPVLAIAAVVTLAVAAGFGLSRLPGNFGSGPALTDSPTAAVSPSETPSISASAPPSPAPQASLPAPNPSGGALADRQRCTNEALGFAVSYPANWFTNDEVEQEFGDPIPACKYFSSQAMDIAPNAGLPPTVAISFERWADVPPTGEGWKVIGRTETTVAGLLAVVTEREQTSDAGAPFSARGDRSYAYEVELPDGSVLTAGTGLSSDGDYDGHKAVLDQMMETLELTGGGTPREPEGPLGP